MKFLLIFVTLIIVVSCQSCPYSRDDAINCGFRYFDKNQDGLISYNEFLYALNRYLTAQQRALLPPIRTSFNLCDVNKDFLLSRTDLALTSSTCFVNCNYITKFIELICAPAKQEYITIHGHAKKKRMDLIQLPLEMIPPGA